MDTWIWISLVMAIAVVVMFFMLKRKNSEITVLKKKEERAWTLKVALEKTFDIPSVEAKELAAIEPQLDRIMNSQGSDEEVEEKMRQVIMELYAKKAEQKDKKDKEENSKVNNYRYIT